MGETLSVLDIAWLIYAHRLSLAGYPFERLHPHVLAWKERLAARPEFAKEIELLRHSREQLEATRRAQEAGGHDARGRCGILALVMRPHCAHPNFRIHFRKSRMVTIRMPSAQRKPLSAFRRRLKRRGVVRVEVHVRKDDAALVRGVAKALADPARQAEARALLRERFGAGKAKGLKALLAAAPLEGIDLTRERDLGRDAAL